MCIHFYSIDITNGNNAQRIIHKINKIIAFFFNKAFLSLTQNSISNNYNFLPFEKTKSIKNKVSHFNTALE